MRSKDYYAALEVPRDADADAIKKSYRRLARKYHPDVSREPDAERRFKEINEAYDTLKEPHKRAAYDALHQPRPAQPFERSRDRRERFDPGSFASAGHTDLADLLAALARQHGARGHADRPRPGRDVNITAAISLEDAHRGTTLELQLPRPEGSQILQVTIPAGVTEGRRLRLQGKGEKGSAGGPDGDLYVHLQLLPHPRYRVDGKDLYCDLALAPWEAALGAQVVVPTLDGDVLLTVPQATHPGHKLRLRGRGVGTGPDRGDMYCVVRMQMPTTLTPRERELLEALARESRFDPRGQRCTS